MSAVSKKRRQRTGIRKLVGELQIQEVSFKIYDQPAVPVDAIIARVSVFHGIPVQAILGKNGKKGAGDVCRARQEVMWLARKLTPLTTVAVGSEIGGRDHSTVVHGAAVIDELISKGDVVADDVIVMLAEFPNVRAHEL